MQYYPSHAYPIQNSAAGETAVEMSNIKKIIHVLQMNGWPIVFD